MVNLKKFESALIYAEQLGWFVLPLHAIREDGTCTCGGYAKICTPGKHPIAKYVPKGLKDATNDTKTIQNWWTEKSYANIGVVTGAKSGIIVLDIDTKPNKHGKTGLDSLKEIEAQYGKLPRTVSAITGSGGRHLFFKYPDYHVANSVSSLAHGIDIKGDGGYIIVAPSNHSSGNSYVWENDPLTTEIAEVPEWLNEYLQQSTKNTVQQHKQEYSGRIWTEYLDGEEIVEGTRDTQLFKIGCSMRAKGACYEDILATLIEINNTRVTPPLDEQQVLQKAESSMRYHAGDIISPQSSTKSLLDFPDSDEGNAERLIQRHGIDIKYCTQWNQWLIWDGVHWKKDDTFEIYRRAVETVRAFHDEAQEAYENLKKALLMENGGELNTPQKEELKQAEKRVKFARQSENRNRLTAMIDLAKTVAGVPVTVDQLDTDKHKINLLNGTYNLKTNELEPHSRNDLITKVANVSYDPTATATRWEQFVAEIMDNNRDMIEYIQRVMGLSLSGDTSEEYLYISHGSGSNGKSKFFGAIINVLGDYAQQANSNLLMAKNRDPSAPNPDLVRVRGARLVVTSETEEGKRLDESLVKSLTGNDLITTRDLHEKSFSFRPEAKFFLTTNHKPYIFGTDKGIWRRVLLIPFEVSFEGAKKDIHLEEKLAAEKMGIFNWMLEGYRKWTEQGVNPPEKVIASTQEYRAEMDKLGAFLEDCCVVSPNARVSPNKLFGAYRVWSEETDEKPMSRRIFVKRLKERGFKQGKDSTGRYWDGIGLLDQQQNTENEEKDEAFELNTELRSVPVPMANSRSQTYIEGEL